MDSLQKRIILKALDNERLLTEWEINFVNSLADKPDDYEISYAQNKCLHKIWEKISA